jgi:hypothetical protein
MLYGTDAYVRRRGEPKDPNDLQDHDVVMYSARHPAAAWRAQAFASATLVLSAPSMQVAAAGIEVYRSDPVLA